MPKVKPPFKKPAAVRAKAAAAPRAEKAGPPCSHWKDCGGCPLIRYDYKEQLARKRAKVRDAYLQTGYAEDWLDSLLKKTRPSPVTLGYRNKAKWILQPDEKGLLKMGIYYPGTHEVVDIPKCSVHAPAINELSGFIKQKLIDFEVPCGVPVGGNPTLRYLIVRYSFREKKLLTVFVSSAPKVPNLEKVFESVAKEYGDKVVAMVQNINDDSGNVLLGEANRFQRKQGELTETMGRFRVPVGPLSFLQVNSAQASYLYRRARELLGKGPFKAGLDLYSGVGLFAFHMADTTEKILAVEEVGPAALEGITAARRNRIGNVLQLCADAFEGITTFVSEWGHPDWVVLNPPRKGCDPGVLQALLQRPPAKLVYVSCNPVTQARDIRILMEACPSLELKTVEPVDMFPQTDHVEVIAYLVNKQPGRPATGTEGSSKGGKPLH
jgi:23S rRNA (uracil1939-C5)-methyltransferase